MSIPVFMDLEANDQLAELRSHMRSKNIAIRESTDNLNVEDNLLEVIIASEKLWKEVNNEAELELLFNSIISLNIVLPRDKIEAPTMAICQVLGQSSGGNEKKNMSKLKLLNHLFIGLDNSPLKYHVFSSLVQLAGKAELLHQLNLKLEDVKAWVQKWNVGVPEYQVLLRTLHEIYVAAKLSDRASKVMLELLGTYSEENAAQAREDARRCIVTCIADPTVLLLDHLLLLKPVKFLEGELIHDLVSIFVTGRLNHYMEFYQKHKDVVESNGLNHEKNVKKMRLLTFLSLAEGSSELSFESIEQELQLLPNQAESFVIEVIRSKAAQARIVQTQKKVVVTSAINRTFGRAQWLQLKEKLSVWQMHLQKASTDVGSTTFDRI